jgi:hypothetical protein
MSTRRTDSDTLNQERWCSSPEFTEGTINALLAAKRIALVEDPKLRELLWFIQWRSLKAGGIKTLARELVDSFPERVGTPLLRRWCDEPSRLLNGREVKAIEAELPDDAKYLAVDMFIFLPETEGRSGPKKFYTTDFTTNLIRSLDELPEYLMRLCLDPSIRIAWETSPWYFKDILGALRQVRSAGTWEAKHRLADTEISRKMNETLDFCYRRRRMVFIEGAAGIGRSATIQAWCEAHGGMVRYVETPSSNDDRSFYAKIAEALGVARGLSFAGQQIKLRVEETLRVSGLVIAMDEAQYLWPQFHRPRGIPSRLLWIKTAFDAGTPFAIVAHTDFSKWQKLYVEKTMWTDEQWERRLNRKVFLPAQHSEEDMMLIAKKKFPEGNEATWMLLTGYALAAEKKQASAITELLESARDRAELDGREETTFEDIEAAIQGDHLSMQEAISTPVAGCLHHPCNGNAKGGESRSESSPRPTPATGRRFSLRSSSASPRNRTPSSDSKPLVMK